MTDEDSRRAARERVRRLGPLSSLLLPALLAAFVLPSALNVNQSNPSPTLEYAPVPASDENPPPQVGNLSSLALASSTGLQTEGDAAGGEGGDGSEPPDPLDVPPPLQVPPELRKPSSKTCIGTPPRQTEDPYSPPCVAVFKGDNGGATYQGVSKDEIKVLFYVDAYNFDPPGSYWDIAKPSDPTVAEPDFVKNLRVWQQYFNQRYQTYGRFVRFYAFSANDGGAEGRRADAVQNFQDIKPFATIIHAPLPEPYIEEMARRGVMAFTGGLDGGQFISAETYSEARPHAWGSYASSELKAQIFASYLCRQIEGKPVAFGEVDRGGTRKYGFWYAQDPRFPEVTRYGQQVLPLLKQCGIEPIPHAYSVGHWAIGGANTQASANAVADWQRQGVTTVIWAGNEEAGMTRAMGNAAYFPELILSDDHFLSGNYHSRTQDARAFRNAVLVTDIPAFKRVEDTYCHRAYRETDAKGAIAWACYVYPSLQQLFTAVQTAGPRLTPQSVDQGLHAIPAVTSKDPTVPACFYLPGDYTCIKDAVLQYWDAAQRAGRPSYDQGPCWRVVDDGQRHIAGQWPEQDRAAATDRVGGSGYCNNGGGGVTVTTTSVN